MSKIVFMIIVRIAVDVIHNRQNRRVGIMNPGRYNMVNKEIKPLVSSIPSELESWNFATRHFVGVMIHIERQDIFHYLYLICDSFKPFWTQKYKFIFSSLQKRMNGMNIGKAAVLALVASWAIYGQERVRIPEKKAGGGVGGRFFGGGTMPRSTYAPQSEGQYSAFNR